MAVGEKRKKVNKKEKETQRNEIEGYQVIIKKGKKKRGQKKGKDKKKEKDKKKNEKTKKKRERKL